MLLDYDGRLGSTFHSVGLPTTLFFGADGRHAATHVGEVSAAALADYLAAISPPVPTGTTAYEVTAP